MAETVRFELTDPFESLVFKTRAIDHSTTFPYRSTFKCRHRRRFNSETFIDASIRFLLPLCLIVKILLYGTRNKNRTYTNRVKVCCATTTPFGNILTLQIFKELEGTMPKTKNLRFFRSEVCD